MILCAGEALIDMLPRTTEAGEDAFAPYPGGAVFNTAIALGRLGAPVGFFSGLSTDLFGQMLEQSLAASGVESGLAHRSDKPTTLAFVKLTDGQASYAFYDENTAGRMLSAEDLPVLDGNTGAVFFGGISLVVEPCAAAYEALCAREAALRVIMLDPNIRPGFIHDEAAYRARIGRMIGMADIVKVSDEDLAWIMGEGDPA
ncbi:MAG: carbohydrate kinase, partial [Paracoccaceae bacterium]|nr:carbohydrate kinase [Paracoccaceae bacterium]